LRGWGGLSVRHAFIQGRHLAVCSQVSPDASLVPQYIYRRQTAAFELSVKLPGLRLKSFVLIILHIATLDIVTPHSSLFTPSLISVILCLGAHPTIMDSEYGLRHTDICFCPRRPDLAALDRSKRGSPDAGPGTLGPDTPGLNDGIRDPSAIPPGTSIRKARMEAITHRTGPIKCVMP
jgi:hypothetical protein